MPLDSLENVTVEYECREGQKANLRTLQDLQSSALALLDGIYWRCSAITEIDDEPVEVVGLKLVGNRRVDKVVLTYVGEEAVSRTYSLQEFYETFRLE